MANVLGIDIGGANLKAATVDRRAVSMPFALWKEPQTLTAKLVELISQFPDATEFAVTMTGELCDCYETKREGVTAIVNAKLGASRSFPLRFWSTEGKFVSAEQARSQPMRVAAANWHALAKFCGAYSERGTILLLDIGSTTTDVIPILDGEPWTEGKTDVTRMQHGELVYTGFRRTPVSSVLDFGQVATELFATTLDAYLLLGYLPENAEDCDTADGRPATRANAHARLSRMLCGDPELISTEETMKLAGRIFETQFRVLQEAVSKQIDRLIRLQESSLGHKRLVVVSGSGEFLAKRILERFRFRFTDFVSLTDSHGPELATCAPAYALAVLGTERRD